ncbi:MAG: pyruvate flavodoxin/ferredoxin oxidoreductase, partial [Desulfobacterales bacterium]
NIDIHAIAKPEIIERSAPPPGKPFVPFEISSGQLTPYFLPIGGNVPVRQTSSTHGPDGYITTDSDKIAEIQERLKAKLVSSVNGFSFHESYPEERADTLLLTYGVTARAARDAYKAQKKYGKPVSLLILKTLWPVPQDLIREKAGNARRVIVMEMNLGQYVREIERILPDKKIDFLGQMDGRLITPHRIQEVIAHV